MHLFALPHRDVPGLTAGACRHTCWVALFLAFCATVPGCKKPEAEGEKEDKPAPVKWEEGARNVVLEEWTELVGATQPLPDHAARVTSPVSARVMAVLPAQGDKKPVEGQMVEAGDILVQLDTTLVDANMAKAEAARKVLLAEKEVAAVALKQAEVDLKSLEELKRTQSSQTILVSPVMLEKATLALESAKAALEATNRRLEAADKEVAALKLELGLYTLRAPRKGRLGRLQVVTGQTLPAGQAVAEVLGIEDEIDVLCFVSASDARAIQIGQPAHIGGLVKESTAAGPEGKVVYIADQAELETGSFAVKVRFPNSDLKLRASAITRVRVQTKPGKDCWCVPESALIEDQDPPCIVVVDDVKAVKTPDGKEEQQGTARRLRAHVGVRDRVLGYVEIVKVEDRDKVEDPAKKWQGDLEHARIVIAKGQGVQTGDKVKLEEEDDD